MRAPRAEVSVYLALSIAFVASWMFLPAWSANSEVIKDELFAYGMRVKVMGESMLYQVYIAALMGVYGIASGMVPVIWKTKYALYSSLVIDLIDVVLMVDTLVLRYRYLMLKGYYVVPTPTGYMTFTSPITLSLGVPFWLLIGMVIVAELNLTTRASWLHPKSFGPVNKAISKLGEGPLNAVEVGLKALHVPFKREAGKILVGPLTVYEGKPPEIKGEVYFFMPKHAYHATGNLVEPLSLEDGVRAVLGTAVARVMGVEENEYERE